jgi:hypothetical protein
MDWFAKLWDAVKSFIPADKQAEVEAKLKEIKIEEPKKPEQKTEVDLSKVPAELKPMFEKLQTQISALTQMNKDLLAGIAEEKKTREASIQAEQDRLKKENEKKITDTVAADLKAGKYKEALKEHYIKLYTADYDSTLEAVKNMPGDKHFAKDNKEKDANPDKTETKTIDPIANGNQTILKNVKTFANVAE